MMFCIVTNTLYMYNHPHSHGSSLVFSHDTFNLQLVIAQVAYTDIRYIYAALRSVPDVRQAMPQCYDQKVLKSVTTLTDTTLQNVE
jgi:hypothetical protein